MNAEEIRDIAIDSAKVYYEYLEKNNKGIQEIEVYEISYLESVDVLIKLRLSAKLFDTEAVFFYNLRNNKKYDTSQVKIIEYDADNNLLLAKPIIEFANDFKNLKNADLKVISDLKFLVQRVKSWYEKNGSQVKIPTLASKLSETFEKISYFPEKKFQPSSNQKDSIKNIFQHPFTYVWGAPGTGKTQFVLSYAILHYINNGCKVAILAPTNNSIEQVLRGVIKMTDKAGIDRKQLIRLGTPSRKFAEDFPEVCEEKGVQKKLDELDKQIAILEKILQHGEAEIQIESCEESLASFGRFPELMKINTHNKTTFENENEKLVRKDIDIRFILESIKRLDAEKLAESKKLNSIFNKLIKLFSSKPTVVEKRINLLDIEILDKKKEYEYLKYESSELKITALNAKVDFDKSVEEIKDHINQIKSTFSQFPEFATIVSDLDENNWSKKEEVLAKELLRKKESLKVDRALFLEYGQTSVIWLREELDSYRRTRVKLAGASTDERIRTVNVIACTLDGYIGRYTESRMNVDHIFMDEAGYANIIKTMTLFNHPVPISFLGDHMQLPPVCEINNDDIRRDNNYQNIFLWAQSSIFLGSLFSSTRDFCLAQYLGNYQFTAKEISQSSLNTTYRFGNNLADILGKHVYNSGFSSSNSDGDIIITFVHASKTEPFKSRESANEVEAIRKVTDILKSTKSLDYVILTPYKKQLKLLNKSLTKERNEMKIMTVHGSQGREWETVIFSVVDTGDKWFVDSMNQASRGLNLINTAVSRVKKELIIVCDKNYWYHQRGQLITDLLKVGAEQKY